MTTTTATLVGPTTAEVDPRTGRYAMPRWKAHTGAVPAIEDRLAGELVVGDRIHLHDARIRTVVAELDPLHDTTPELIAALAEAGVLEEARENRRAQVRSIRLANTSLTGSGVYVTRFADVSLPRRKRVTAYL